MQVILTEEEYLKLKNQHEEQKKTYIKRIDVAMSLQDMVKELVEKRGFVYDPITFQPKANQWQEAIDHFWERIDGK